ncbi:MULTISPECIES: CBM35 domain-containing protein [unclassified Streptomyces]|uniref:CBM35 domain-containing protein n=1 Tax=unclassified Streptomyces TaxID=2593676 RepID=UPI0016604CC6|nr:MULTISPECIES: CBM35 domain-containing protein [unclassified Streptomyces]MBD0712366.1 carbohydrate-binding protein [Streptomyces sp. CBMA291]MBD0716740.1 carbohydrate-binding protein [Streptomyces sp. CBMA370]
MAAGNDGANTPENDDPFGYLYADGQAAGAQAPQGGGYGYPGPAPAQPGVPRTSYNQVRTVGERQYGQQQPYVPPQQQQAPYGQPQAQYAAPETYGGPPTRVPPPPQQQRGGGRGPNTKGLLIGAVAIVAVVVAGIAAAVINNAGSEKDKDPQAGTGAPATATAKPSQEPTGEPTTEKTPAELPKQDAATLKLGGTAALAKDVQGAEGSDGTYVSGFNQVGSSVTWKADMPGDGKYRLTVRYAIPAVDAFATLTVNGKPNSLPIGLKNFIHSSDPNLEKNWQTTWAPVTLQKGENEIKISCEDGNQCDVLLDWLEVTQVPG